MLTSGDNGIFAVCILNISDLDFLSGICVLNILSNLPGLNKAGSIISGLFVAAITTTSFNSSNPSISESNVFSILSVTRVPTDNPLLGAIASISSKNIIAGDACLAFSNI